MTQWPSHAALLRAMYRQLLRGLEVTRRLPVTVSSRSVSPTLALYRELVKAEKNPVLYGEFLTSELRYRIEEEFRTQHLRVNERSLLMSLVTGEKLITLLDEVKKDPLNSTTWNAIVEILVEHRHSEMQRAQWKQSYLRSKPEIDRAREKDLDPLTAKRLRFARLRTLDQEEKFTSLSASQRRKALKAAIASSRDNGHTVVRNYLKKLQVNGRIPNPYKLAYVPASLTSQTPFMPKEETLIPGSTRHAVLDAAYDLEYVESILKPEVEFSINHHHYMADLERIVEQEGPYKVKIRSTNAGVMLANFIRLPFNRHQLMQEIALDVKKLVRAARKAFIWNLGPGQKLEKAEKKLGEAYSVRGSKGFTVSEYMYPREYYEKLTNAEAEWELLMELERLKAKYGPDIVVNPKFKLGFNTLARSVFADWNEPLEEATKLVNDEVSQYYDKYKVDRDSPIWDDQMKFQLMMNDSFKNTVSRYTKLLAKLEKDRVFVHSELYRPSLVTQNYKRTMAKEEKKTAKNKHGLPELERTGQGKTLGDYLEEYGFKAYKMGYKFAQRFRFLQKRDHDPSA